MDGAMELERISQEELLVRLDSNPGTTETQEWIEQFKGSLTGEETLTQVDLTEISILSSLGVNVVVGIFQRMKKQGGTVRVRVANSKVLRVFELFQLTELFEVRVDKS